MKKEYIKPEIEVVDVEIESLMSTTSTDVPVGGWGDADAPVRRDRRGSWGNLWSEED